MPAKETNGVEKLTSEKHLKKKEALSFVVIAVFKSPCSDIIKTFYPDLNIQPLYQYELQIKDLSGHSTKVLLSPSLNYLVEFEEIKCGCMINISDYFTKISEYSSPPKQITCVNNLSITSKPTNYTINPLELDDTPLCSRIPYYYPLFNHDSFIDINQCRSNNSYWNNDPTPYYYTDTDINIPTISQSLKKKNHLAVYGRIIKKSYIMYTTKQSYNEIYPFQYINIYIYYSFNIIIEDIKGNTIDVSIWSEICGKYYNILKIGQLIIISNYKTTKYNNKLELKLNPIDPSRSDINTVGEGKILILNNNNNPISLIPLQLSSIKDTLLSPDDIYINIYGIITYITPILRYNKINNKDNSKDCFHHYRYIRIRDNSTSIELYCLLRSNSQYSILESLSLSQHILLTNLYVKSSFLFEGSCFNERYCYIQSTDYSEYIINLDQYNYNYDRDYIKVIDSWYDIESKNITISTANNQLIGFTHQCLYYSLPFILHSKIIRNDLFTTFDNDNNVSISKIQSILNNLQYKESLLIPIIGHISNIIILNDVENKNEKRRKIIDKSSGYMCNIVIEDVNRTLTVNVEVNSNYIIGCIPTVKHIIKQLCELYSVTEPTLDSLLSISKSKYIELNITAVCEYIELRKCYLHSITQIH